MKAAVVIPARLKSTRLPGKLLLSETGKPLVQHTYESACRASIPQKVIIAADSPEIAEALSAFQTPVVLTSPDHTSGTDRIAEASRDIDADIIVNVQGDEPEIKPEVIDNLCNALDSDPACVMATAACPLDPDRITDPACVKVVTDKNGTALYFSRAPIPFLRDEGDLYGQGPLLHIGIYAYRKDFLTSITQCPPSPLEKTEKLEQLRVLENGHRIKVIITETAAPGIDTPEDYRDFVKRHNR